MIYDERIFHLKFNQMRKLFIRILLFAAFLFFNANSALIFSQTTYIDGKILNSGTMTPVPFAAIKLKINQLGVFANAEGDFKIINNAEFQNDSLIITCIGFKRNSISYKDLRKNEVNKIYLTQAIYNLAEVKVSASRKKLTSVRIIGRAIRNIRNNYPDKPFNFISYYRDYQKKEGTYINLNEAIVQTLDNGFGVKSIFTNYRLVDFRKNMDFQRMNVPRYYKGYEDLDDYTKIIPNAKLGDQYGNELFILMTHDAIRNYNTRSFSFVDIFSEDFLLNHSFSEPVSVYNNNLLLLRIEFKARPRLTNDSLLVSGAIYIQPRDYSIHKLEYSCYYLTKGKENKEMFNVDIEYGYESSVNSLMCLKYISFNNIFTMPDSTDSNYFRVLKSYWNPSEYSKATLVFEFSKNVDKASASRKDNYEIVIKDKPVQIQTIQVSGKKVLLKLKEENNQRLKDKTVIHVRKIKDIEGSLLDKPKFIQLYQYRELFVQEYNKSLPFKDSCNMQYLPLEQNCISRYYGKDKYWMNTPANIKNVK